MAALLGVTLLLAVVSFSSVVFSSFGALTAIWPTNAIALIALLRGPRDIGWRVGVIIGLYAALVGAVMLAGAPPVAALALSATNLIEIAVATALLVHFRLARADLTQPGALFGFLVCVALIGPMAAASAAAPMVAALSPGGWAQAWWDYFAADALGAMIIAPFGMVLTRDRLKRLASTADKLWAALLFLGLSAACVYLAKFSNASLALLAPLVVLATLRFGALGAASAVLWSGVLALGLSLTGFGAADASSGAAAIRASLFDLQLGLAVLPLASLPIAAVLAQRDRALIAATAAERARNAFLTNMSHEIRTPLNGVIGMAEILSRTTPRAADRELALTIRSSGEALQRMLCDILDLARMESGDTLLEDVAFDLRAMIHGLADEARAKLDGGPVAVAVDLPADLAALRQGPASELRQALAALLDNAAKVTKAGGVTLSLRAGDDDALTFTVRDTGPGFDLATLDTLCGAFAQADGSLTRTVGGAGLGLSIVRHLVEDMGGTLAFANRPEGGAEVSITLSLARQSEAAATPAEPVAETAPTPEPLDRAPRILMAEDTPANRMVVELILGMVDVELTSVENGAEAVAAFTEGDYDLVLMDVQMPVMDGLSAVRAIRAREAAERGRRTPILMLTANALPEHRTASAAAGADAHLTKPITAPVLLGAVEQALSGGVLSCESAAA
ncbi:MAG TPA: ATP-binding protein [Brevundimonas sp.]